MQTTVTKYCYGESYPSTKTHYLLLPQGETIEFLKTESEAQGQVNYHYFVLGKQINYIQTDEIPSKYMWSNPEGADFILFDENDVIVKPIPFDTIQEWISTQ